VAVENKPLTLEQAKEFGQKYGVQPVKLDGKEYVQIAGESVPNGFVPITWDEFYEFMKNRNLVLRVHATSDPKKGGYLRIYSSKEWVD
jgi:hypothetical protein